jgi:hypothetical protein
VYPSSVSKQNTQDLAKARQVSWEFHHLILLECEACGPFTSCGMYSRPLYVRNVLHWVKGVSQYFRRICHGRNVRSFCENISLISCAVQKNTIQKSGKFVNWVQCWIKIKYKNLDSSQMRHVYIKWEHDEPE